MRSVSVCLSRTPVLGANAFHREVDGHIAGFFKTQGCLDVLALFEGLLQSNEHHVITARLELQRLTRLDVKAADGPHLHHATLHAHLVDFETVGYVRRAAHESIADIAAVGDRHVTPADRCALWRRAYPGGGNLQAARGDVLSLCRPCHENGKGGDESKTNHDERRHKGRRWTCPAPRVCVDCVEGGRSGWRRACTLRGPRNHRGRRRDWQSLQTSGYLRLKTDDGRNSVE